MFGFQMDVLKFFIFSAVLSLALLVSESLGMVFAMICKTADIAIVLASILFIILLSLTGFMTSNMPTYYSWIQYISFMRYARASLQPVSPQLHTLPTAASPRLAAPPGLLGPFPSPKSMFTHLGCIVR